MIFLSQLWVWVISICLFGFILNKRRLQNSKTKYVISMTIIYGWPMSNAKMTLEYPPTYQSLMRVIYFCEELGYEFIVGF